MLILEPLQLALNKAAQTFLELWPLLLVSILISVILKLYVDQDRVTLFLRRNKKNNVALSTALAVGTPFCSCGTTAVVLGMMASTVPWAPIVAFLVASPLTSPQELFYSAGLFGWPFAIAFMLSSIILGIAGGMIAGYAEERGWLKNQARIQYKSENDLTVINVVPTPTAKPHVTSRQFGSEFFNLSWKLVLMFFGFSFLGYFLNGIIPQNWIGSIFGSGKFFSVPLAAILGLPFYLNTEASLPLISAFMDAGMSPGSALAFLITGAGTSIGAFAGALTIARWRVIGIVIGTLVIGAILLGSAYDLLSLVIA